MTRTILALTILLPATVLAQEQGPSQQTSADVPTAAVSQSPAQRATPAPAVTRAKRRPSMVGYIDDGRVQSQFRIRFDAGFQNDLPDRSEFFYAKCGCYQGLATAIPAAFDPNAPGPGPGVPKDLNFQQLYLSAEYAPHNNFSVFAEIPARWIQPSSFLPIPPFAPFTSQSGLGDIRAGVKLGIVSSAATSLTVQLRGYFPSGNASKGLGTNHGSFEPALLYYQQVSDRLTVESQIGDWHPMGGSIGVPSASSDKFSGDVFFYGIGPSYEVYSTNTIRFAPVIELVGWNVRGGFATLPGGPVAGAATDASGTNIVNLKFGARVVVRDRSSFYIGYGHVLTNSAWYQNIVRIEIRSSF